MAAAPSPQGYVVGEQAFPVPAAVVTAGTMFNCAEAGRGRRASARKSQCRAALPIPAARVPAPAEADRGLAITGPRRPLGTTPPAPVRAIQGAIETGFRAWPVPRILAASIFAKRISGNSPWDVGFLVEGLLSVLQLDRAAFGLWFAPWPVSPAIAIELCLETGSLAMQLRCWLGPAQKRRIAEYPVSTEVKLKQDAAGIKMDRRCSRTICAKSVAVCLLILIDICKHIDIYKGCIGNDSKYVSSTAVRVVSTLVIRSVQYFSRVRSSLELNQHLIRIILKTAVGRQKRSSIEEL